MTRQRKILISQIVMVIVLLLGIVGFQLINTDSTHIKEKAVYSSNEDFNGQVIMVQPDSEYEDFAKEYYPQSELKYVTEWADMAQFVASGKAEMMLCEDVSVHEILEAFDNLYVMSEPLAYTNYHFVTNKTEKGDALVAEFNEFLKEYDASGMLDEIYAKWTSDNEDEKVLYTTSYPKGEILQVSTYTDWYPYTYMNNGQPSGLYVDLISEFCVNKGYVPVINNVAPDSALLGVTTGKYDIDIYGRTYSEERAQKVNFSDELYGGKMLVVTRASRVIGAQGETKNGLSFIDGIKESLYKNFVVQGRWKMVINGLKTTVALAIFSIIFGTLIGALIFWLHGRKNPFAAGFARLYIKFFQGIPDVLLLRVLFYIIFRSSNMNGEIICIIGFSLAFSAYVAEIIRSGVEAVSESQTRAALALGYSKRQAFFKIILPQAVNNILPVYKGEIVSLIKDTSIAGYVAVEDLTKVSDLIRAQTYEAIFPLAFTAIFYFLLAGVLVSLLRMVERHLDPTHRKVPKLPESIKKMYLS